MITFNKVDYNVCLLDTNILSELIKHPNQWKERIFKLSFENLIICYSVASIIELMRKSNLYNKYIDIFSVFPSFILDAHEGILEKEIQYQAGKINEINPIIVPSTEINDGNLSKREALKYLFEKTEFNQNADIWQRDKSKIINGIISLIDNYLPKQNKYTLDEIEYFVDITTKKQIKMWKTEYYHQVQKQKREIISYDYPSIRCTGYMIFYKFYQDKRKPLSSDVFDIIISSLFPYVDVVITERNMCEIIRKIKERHGFLQNLSYYTLSNLKNQ